MKLPATIKELIEIREKQIPELEAYIPYLEAQYIATNSVNTGAAVGTVVGTGLLFSPFFLAGAIVLGVSAVTSVSTTVGDAVATKVRSDSVCAIMKKSNETENELKDLLDQLQKNVDLLVKEKKGKALSQEDAEFFILMGVIAMGNSIVDMDEIIDRIASLASPTSEKIVVTTGSKLSLFFL